MTDNSRAEQLADTWAVDLLLRHLEESGHESGFDYDLGPYCATCAEKETVTPDRAGNGLWRLDLICCGHADGHVVRETWTEANEFRDDYCRGTGHERQAILVRDEAHTGLCNGYTPGCPLPGGSFLELSR